MQHIWLSMTTQFKPGIFLGLQINLICWGKRSTKLIYFTNNITQCLRVPLNVFWSLQAVTEACVYITCYRTVQMLCWRWMSYQPVEDRTLTHSFTHWTLKRKTGPVADWRLIELCFWRRNPTLHQMLPGFRLDSRASDGTPERIALIPKCDCCRCCLSRRSLGRQVCGQCVTTPTYSPTHPHFTALKYHRSLWLQFKPDANSQDTVQALGLVLFCRAQVVRFRNVLRHKNGKWNMAITMDTKPGDKQKWETPFALASLCEE